MIFLVARSLSEVKSHRFMSEKVLNRIDLCSLTLSELESHMQHMGEAAYRAQQVMDWVYRKKVTSFDAMTNLCTAFRSKLGEHFLFPVLRLGCQEPSDEVIKFLWELEDGKNVESVLISAPERRTVCVSTQVGCPGRCAFCASGKKGLVRSLSTAEIVEQVLHIDRFLHQDNERVSHIVYMGMGEPLQNYEAVLQSIQILTRELTISQRRITVSTVGIVEGIRRLAHEDLSVNLALSLHAPNQELRKKIIPFARQYPLEEVLIAMDFYQEKTGRDITYEYTLIEGFNDQPQHAQELVSLVGRKQCSVNLIPYNQIDQVLFRRPSKEAVVRFRDILERAGVPTTWRYTKGDDIAAACGQLAAKFESIC